MLQTLECSEPSISDLLTAWVHINNSLILSVTCLVLPHSSLRRRIFLSSDISSFAEGGIGNFDLFLGGSSSLVVFLLTF